MTVFFSLLAFPLPVASQERFTLDVPIACAIGTDCFVQNYADLDPTPAYSDQRCGALTYNEHKGIDFRLRNMKQMQAGVAVLASAEGMVKATRDGMRDVSVREIGKDAIRDRDCGNGVVVGHRGGWETQYCHMKQGSITVKRGQMVKPGEKLGLVGLSGNTEFPHVHLSVRHGQDAIDPYTGQKIPLDSKSSSYACRESGDAGSLWSPRARAVLTYIPTALLNAGFSAEAPQPQTARDGTYDTESLPANIPIIGLWVDIMGIQAGDALTLRLLGADGKPIVENTKSFESPKALQFGFVGDRLHAPLAPGLYTGKITLVRQGKTVIDETRTVSVK